MLLCTFPRKCFIMRFERWYRMSTAPKTRTIATETVWKKKWRRKNILIEHVKFKPGNKSMGQLGIYCWTQYKGQRYKKDSEVSYTLLHLFHLFSRKYLHLRTINTWTTSNHLIKTHLKTQKFSCFIIQRFFIYDELRLSLSSSTNRRYFSSF